MDPFLSHGWACFKALNLAGTEDPAFFYHASVEIREPAATARSGDPGSPRREEHLLGGTVRGVGLAKGLAQEDLPLPVADLQRTRESTGKLRELVVENGTRPSTEFAISAGNTPHTVAVVDAIAKVANPRSDRGCS